MMLSCEITQEKDVVEIVFDKEGLAFFKEIIEDIGHGLVNDLDHVHLRTKEWGGIELSSNAVGENNSLINHLKLVYINE